MGPPGSGKGSNAKLLQQHINLPHLSTGDIFRQEVNNKTPLGIKIEDTINEGKLISDELTAELIEKRIQQQDCDKGFILDGYPRTVNQAEILDKIFAKLQIKDYIVVDLIVDNNVLIKRILGRYICEKCGAIYNEYFNPPKVKGVCDICGNINFIKRKDDNEETITKRLSIYKNETVPVLQYYQQVGKLFEVDGLLPNEDIVQNILYILNK
ncbi:UNVERIFIED_CONTAM: hypothetical protein PYX00_011111 [Menopon gallinae]|uniref:Adenylate kinase active site lid domain-containing protein n=1 Tax=Menopon gallinae TaxID=328185 RepID=A0AAW2H5X6_9NEOP